MHGFKQVKQSSKSQIKLILIVSIFSVILGIVSWKSTPKLRVSQPDASCGQSAFNRISLEYEGFTEKNGTIVPESTTEDITPRFYVKNLSDTINLIEIDLESALPEGTEIQLYYTYVKTGGSYREDDVVSVIAKKDQTKFYFEVPLNYYEEFRFDLDKKFAISDIKISGNYTEAMPAINPVSFILIFAGLLLTAEIIFHFHKHIFSYAIQRWNNRQYILRFCIKQIIIAAAVFDLALLFSHFFKINLNYYYYAFFILLALLLNGLWQLRKTVGKHPERVFAFVALIIGSMFILVEPVGTNISLDDAVHYKKALVVSYGGEAYATEADYQQFNLYKADTIDEINVMDSRDNFAVSTIKDTILQPRSISYVPLAAGLWLGRLLKLPFHLKFYLAKYFNLITYIVLVYIAVRKIKYGKMLMTAIALIPHSLYQAANFTYDAYVYALFMLAFSLFFNEALYKDGFFSIREEIKILVLIIMACVFKIPYCAMFIMLLFVPKNRFCDAKHRGNYYKAIIAAVIAAGAVFLITYALEPTIITDTRGGTDINGLQQILFIIQNPIYYLKVLFKYLFTDYLAPSNCYRVLTNVGYFPHHAPEFGGYASFGGWIVLLGVLLFTAIGDFGIDSYAIASKRNELLVRSSILLSLFATICALATTFYICFTPVGSDTILGCQGRYLVPILFPMLALFSSHKISCTFDREKFNLCIILILVSELCIGIWNALLLL